jgi:hypothetical protein
MAKLNMMEFRSDILKIIANERVKWGDGYAMDVINNYILFNPKNM